MAPSYTVQAIQSTISTLGEGPHWDIARQSLYYVDLMTEKGTVLRYDPAADKTYKALIGKKNAILNEINTWHDFATCAAND